MFNPEKDDYPQNAAGQPEFASITLHLDPALVGVETDAVVQKMVLATDTPIEAMAKIAPHFGEPELLANPKNAALLLQAGKLDHPVFVYVTPRQGHTVLVTSTPTWDMLVQSPAFGKTSSLLASEKLQEIVAKVQGDLQQFAGGFSSFLVLNLSPDQFEDEGDLGEAGIPEGSSNEQETEATGGNSAESLRDTADIENV